MAKSILGSILTTALKAAGGTPKKKMATAKVAPKAATPSTAGSSARTKTAAEVAKNLGPKTKAKLEEMSNRTIPTPKGWTRTTDVSYSSS